MSTSVDTSACYKVEHKRELNAYAVPPRIDSRSVPLYSDCASRLALCSGCSCAKRVRFCAGAALFKFSA
eukprot:380376-Rhodomonas_salina.1